MLTQLPLIWKNSVRNRRRSAITLLAIGMAVAVLVFVRGTLNGVQALMKDRVIYGQTGVVQIHKRGFVTNVRKSPLQFGFAVDTALLDKIRAVETGAQGPFASDVPKTPVVIEKASVVE